MKAFRRRALEAVLHEASVEVNGPNPWDLQVNDDRFFDYVFDHGDLGIGESYVRGWWDCPRIDELVCGVLSHNLLAHVKHDWRTVVALIKRRLFNLQSMKRATVVAERHYDSGNEFFQSLLGPTMVYSCAYWRQAAGLEEAQERKCDLICRKLQIEKTDTVLDLGCGWGWLPHYIASRYGCRVTGITISRQQWEYAKRLWKGLPVNVLLADYRTKGLRFLGSFSKIVSVGMFEHVGSKNHGTFLRIVHSMLRHDGLLLLHTIGGRGSAVQGTWIQRYIFPNSELPSLEQLARQMDDLFIMEDWHNFGADYDKTLMAWYANFESGVRRLALANDETFCRTWRYYLLSCAGSFRARSVNELWQIMLSKTGVRGGYVSVR